MPQQDPLDPGQAKALVLRILDENHTMVVATNRPDGWPQATTVGFVHDELTLYFVVARESQKLVNLRRDPRASIAVGRPLPEGHCVRGLSMAVHVDEVRPAYEIERLNALVHARYPGVAVFAPRQSNSAVLRAEPELVSLVDESAGLRQPVLLRPSAHTDLGLVEPHPEA